MPTWSTGPLELDVLPYPMRVRSQERGVSTWKEVLFLSLPIWGVMVPSFISFPPLHSLLSSFCINAGQLT